MRNACTAYRADLLIRCGEQVDAVKPDRARRDTARRRGDQSRQGHGSHCLATAGLAHEAEALTLSQVEADILDSRKLRFILAELGTPAIPSALPVSRIHSAFDDDGNALDESYEKRVIKFLDEFEWYTQALRHARSDQGCSKVSPVQQQICRDKSQQG